VGQLTTGGTTGGTTEAGAGEEHGVMGGAVQHGITRLAGWCRTVLSEVSHKSRHVFSPTGKKEKALPNKTLGRHATENIRVVLKQ
jgi:hypothetical protein